MIFEVTTGSLMNAALRVNKVFEDTYFQVAVEQKNNWVYTNDTGPMIMRKILYHPAPIKILTYSPWWRWSKALAYTKNGKIYINKRRMNRSQASLAGTIAHEAMHVLGYGHGNNYRTKEKDHSVPYFIGITVQKILRGVN